MIKEIKYFKINKHKFQSHSKTLIIAEAGSNHNQNIRFAKNLIDIAAKAKCDAIKFQLFKADTLIQKKQKGWKILNRLELNDKWIPILKKYANKKKLLFGVSPFDVESVKILKKYNIDFVKIASTEIQDITLIKECVKLKKPLIISSGASTMLDISLAIDLIRKTSTNFSLLHTISIYPPKINQLNLRMINSLNKTFGIPVGFSDHSISYIIPSIAVALGACIIEKHITFNKQAKGPDHKFSLNGKELTKMVQGIRETEDSFGSFIKQPAIKNERLGLARRIVLKRDYKRGEKINNKDLIVKRADQKGIHSIDLPKIVNLTITVNLKSDEVLKWDYFK